jgi:hypothetical protein
MKRLSAWHLASVVATFLAAPGGGEAAVQGKKYVCALSVGGWRLCEKDGRAYLAEAGRGKAEKWYVSAPTVKDQVGRALSADPKGRSPSVHLVRDKGPHTRWTFEVLTHLHPRPAKDEPHLKEGVSGIEFKLRVAAGPYKGWYVAAEEPKKRKGRDPVLRPLKLVKDRFEAAVFTYVEAEYEVDHK